MSLLLRLAVLSLILSPVLITATRKAHPATQQANNPRKIFRSLHRGLMHSWNQNLSEYLCRVSLVVVLCSLSASSSVAYRLLYSYCLFWNSFFYCAGIHCSPCNKKTSTWFLRLLMIIPENSKTS